jgi:diguanylate cyclase (GGDEF)-like protein
VRKGGSREADPKYGEVHGLSSSLRDRLSWTAGDDIGAGVITSDRAAAARALVYLLAGIATVVLVSGIPGAPLQQGNTALILGGVAYAAAIGLLIGFDRLPGWVFQALVLGVTAVICWAIYRSGRAGSPYKVFFFWVTVYAAFFTTPKLTAMHVGAVLAGYGFVLLALGGKANNPALHFATTGSALIIVAVAIQGLTASVRRLIERLTAIGRTDSLTGLFDAATFTEMLANEVERARRSGNRLGVMIAEIDGFTSVGSGAVPAARQRQLAAVANVLRTQARRIDTAARLGGARFAVLLPYTDEHGGYLVAERLRSALAELDGAPLHMSVGVAGFPRHGASPKAVLHSAEAALADAIAAGGDRVVLWQRAASDARVEITEPEKLIG